jgi:quercetin dioxygenase-like cupin family protein
MGLYVKRLSKPETIVADSQSSQIHSGYVVLEPGKEVGEHSTRDAEELIVVFEGKGVVVSERGNEKIEAPCIVLVPAHTVHNVRNTSKALLKYAYVLPLR